MLKSTRQDRSPRRRGVTATFVAISLIMLLGTAALTIDVGLMYRARHESQIAADAAAMAGAWELLDEDRLQGSPYMADEITAARVRAADYANYNPVLNEGPGVAESDVLIGYLHDPNDVNAALSFANPNQANTVSVRIRRDEAVNGPVSLLFSVVFGHTTANVAADAWATFKDGVTGWRVTPETGNAGLLPIALHVDAWNGLLDGSWSTGDDWSYDENTGAVAAGSDSIYELNLYPGGGANQLPPGNLGTVDIGSPDNNTADLSRQINSGISEADLAYFGGELSLGPDGTLDLNGDTGLSAAIKDDLEAIVGQARAIPLFNQVTGPGDNATFTIVGFAGIRIMEVKLTGPMNKKRVVIQPAFVVDDAVITSPGSGSSYFVYEPVRLVR